jgi:hypothetical protein
MSPTLARVRAALLLVVALFVALEATRYVTTPLWRMQFEVLPHVGVTATGDLVHWRSRLAPRPYPPGQVAWEAQLYDEARRPGPWTNAQDPEVRRRLEPVVATAWLGGPQVEAAPLVRSGTDGAPWMPLYRHSRAKLLGRPGELVHQIWFPVQMPPAAVWAMQGGRYVWKDADGQVVGGLGPDGWKPGAGGAEGPGFGDVIHLGSRWEPGDGTGASYPTSQLFVDPAKRVLHVLRYHRVRRQDAGVTLTTHPPELRTVPLAGTGEIRALGEFAVAVGDEALVFDADGRVAARAPVGPDEAALTQFAGAWPVAIRTEKDRAVEVVTTLPAPVHPLGAQVRFRVLAAGKEPVVRDVTLAPVTAAEHAMAWARRVPAIVRSPLLSLASFVSPAPATYAEMFSWWLRDPLYAGTSEPLTLVLCLAVGALCALRARQQARLRRPRHVAAWTAAAFVLGPVGLAWMRLVVPKHTLAPCRCGVRRAVDVETCPACGADWPAPAATGAEVIAESLVPA